MKRNIALGALTLVVASLVAPRAKASTTFSSTLSGANEVPATISTATGSATLTLTFNTLDVNSLSFSGLTTPVTAAAIQVAPAGINGPVAIILPGFPTATNGSYSMTLDLTMGGTYNPSFVTANGGTAASAEAALMADMLAGDTYIDIHDATFPGGEIRGQISQTQNVTPEPGTVLLLGTGLLGLASRLSKKRLS